MMQDTGTERLGSVDGVMSRSQHSFGQLRARGMRTLFVGAGVVAVGMVALTAWMVGDSRSLVWDRAVQGSENVAVTLAHEIERNAESYDLSLQAAAAGLMSPGTSQAARRQIVVDHASNAPYFGAMVVLDETGKVVIDSSTPTPPAHSLADQDYFRVHRDNSPGLFIGAPVRGPAGEWRIGFSRRLEHRDGSFAGVIAGSLRLDYFRTLFEHVALGRNGSITLFRTDGTVVMRLPYVETNIDRSLAQAQVFRELVQAPFGSFVTDSAVDGVHRLYSYRQVGSLPLVLSVGQSTEAILSEWWIKALTIGLAVFGLIGVAGLLGAVLSAELRQRSRAETELAGKNATLSAILRELPDAVQVFDRDGKLVAWNEQIFTLADLGPEERERILSAPDMARAFRMTLAERGDYGMGDPEELVAGREETARSGTSTHFQRQTASGRWLDIRGVPTADGGWLGSYRDVSEEVARQHELRDAYERLEGQATMLCATAEDLARAREVAETASRSKSAFLANMSHELRTPLNGVIGFADLMARQVYGPLGHPRYVEYVRDISESGRHLLDLINDVLDFSKVDAGKLELQEDDVDIVATADSAIRMVRPRAQTAGVALELYDEVSHSIAGIRVDERRLKQIVLNLVSNAVKFTPEGGRVTVTVALAEDTGRKGIAVTVADTGIGIDAADLPRVMEAFGQVDHGLNRRQEGTGLGLPLTKRLIELHGGELRIESALGAGTTMVVWLPESRLLRALAVPARAS
jgi:signal transduction histidine kinase